MMEVLFQKKIKLAARDAADRWEQVIVGDLVEFGGIDDLQITVQADLLDFLGEGPSDGLGGTLAEATIDDTRPGQGAGLPYLGRIGIDMADAPTTSPEAFTDLMIHEMGHNLGFTENRFEFFNLLDAQQNFIGSSALGYYQSVQPGALSIPMNYETGAHFVEDIFGDEILTPLLDTSNDGENPLSVLSAAVMEDLGYIVNYAKVDTFTLPGGAVLAPPGALDGYGGLLVRGQEITVESVWDDTDITHVLLNEIRVDNFHSETGIQLRSKPDQSLIVKLDGASAGFTATGTKIDIDDRIGGVVQILGQPTFPVILTSLSDDTVGASVDVLGYDVTDTNLDGVSTPQPGDWRSLEFLPLSHDRNVAVFVESESVNTAGIDENGVVNDAEYLGVLAANYATSTPTVTNTTESAQEKSGNENKRLGFEVHGAIAFDSPGDVDIYAF